ncbi:NUDIX hydrolase [Salirhabdus sp. Marseille-P4669]|uniref:NUDIX hydrolase n=1 Tax=Salirhabdus sp. Marseille-P4669 TaxID=2042310 RepID=UPI000C7BFF8A|nr:NUDIX hydrolase [Salirhabdus sp. Marseille-P4669]
MDATFHLEEGVFNYRVAGIIIKDDHVLLHKQTTDDYWALPGGRVKILEDSNTSLRREMEEELGYHVEVERLLWVTENFFTYKQRPFHELGFYYKIQARKDAPILSLEPFFGLEGERLTYQWFPINKLETISLYPTFLKTALTQIPQHTEHLIIEQK